ncbi:ribosome-associated protein [Rubritalea squalenifaciens DSM 18772]|uniref:Ribosomal silencing factor RsfS n=1 Tax=Rubritalea squalenifaciens DSM 18772 TaxID=1123071 RepID=A0A1M6RYV6_9BACT|nr:ribosome silencing factor [Rubritalea squalenifaciens]SHK37633.1 ribosome-associated protein [Rubritalea squalenifaciens DSM 18772]
MTKVEGIELAKACALAADENKAEDIKIIDVRGLSTLTDFMVICSGNSMPHLKAVLRDTEGLVIERHGVKPYKTEGRAETKWVVLDYVDVMVHVMHEDMRTLYGLEELWGDGKDVQWQEEPASEE